MTQELQKISVTDIMSVQDTKAQMPTPVTVLSVGIDKDFIEMANNSRNSIAGIMWNENGITLVNQNRFVVARYQPIITPTASMFLERHKKRDRDDEFKRIWEGEFVPVQFTKQNLLKFLKTVEMVDAPKEIIDAIKNMKVLERKEQNESISLDEDSSKMVVEESMQTNLPSRFNLMIPVSDDFVGKFEFEAKVVKKKKEYGGYEENKKAIELRVVNARVVLKQRMESIIKQLPQDIPKYYGSMNVRVGQGGWV
jgi:hypothetical protein